MAYTYVSMVFARLFTSTIEPIRTFEYSDSDYLDLEMDPLERSLNGEIDQMDHTSDLDLSTTHTQAWGALRHSVTIYVRHTDDMVIIKRVIINSSCPPLRSRSEHE
eukprot:scaffold8917_cov111-Cylindrotheca_fusiformis.AAC.2